MIQVHLLNQVKVLSPRWHDRVILPACKKFKDGHNIITIAHHNYPSLYIMSKKKAETYPKEVKHSGFGDYEVYVIPLDDLQTIQEYQKEVKQTKDSIEEIGW